MAHDIEISVEYHDELNPKIWDGDNMHLDVRVALLKSALAFLDFLEVENLKIKGAIFVGSNASYNYTQYSDCDVHILMDFSQTLCANLAENFFQTKKTLWNQIHAGVNVLGYNVEIYPEDIGNKVKAAGVYDLLKGEWIKKPKQEKPSYDSSAVAAKVDALVDEIDSICSADNLPEIEEMFRKLTKMRRAGLARAGEFSTENLAFKTIRNLGYIDKLAKSRLAAQDDELSLNHKCPICETPEGGFDRCTVQTVNAFADFYHFQPIRLETEIPLTGEDVVNALQKRGLKMRADPSATGKTLSQWIPAHRTGTWYVSTDGHAMALIQGNLVDAEHKGPDQRRIVGAWEFRR